MVLICLKMLLFFKVASGLRAVLVIAVGKSSVIRNILSFARNTDQTDMEVDGLKARSGVTLHVRYGLVQRNRMRERGADAGVSGGLSGCWFVESQYIFHCRGYSIMIRRDAVCYLLLQCLRYLLKLIQKPECTSTRLYCC